jgi:hypothetical protein
MGLFAFRRLREVEALAQAGASFSIAEPKPKLETASKPKPKRARVAKPKKEPVDGDHD